MKKQMAVLVMFFALTLVPGCLYAKELGPAYTYSELLQLIEEGCTDGIEELLKRHLYGGIRRLGPQIYTDYAAYFEPFDGGSHADLT